MCLKKQLVHVLLKYRSFKEGKKKQKEKKPNKRQKKWRVTNLIYYFMVRVLQSLGAAAADLPWKATARYRVGKMV